MIHLPSKLPHSVLLLHVLCGCSSDPPNDERSPSSAVSDVWPAPSQELPLQSEEVTNPWLSESFSMGGATPGGSESVSPDDKADEPEGIGSSTAGSSAKPVEQDTEKQAPQPVPPVVRFERYKEGSGADKRLHLSQLGAVPAEDCRLEIYSNGGEKVWRTLWLPSPWEPGVELVICTSAESQASCNVVLSGSGYNGNDALVLRCSELVLDRFGRVGEDPGLAWSDPETPETTSKDAELLRCDEPSEASADAPSDVFLIGDHWVRLRSDESIEEALQRCPASQNLGGAGGGLD